MKKILKAFVFICLLFPSLIDNIASITNQLTEFFCTKIAVKSYKLKKEIEVEVEEESLDTTVMGFQGNKIAKEEIIDE